MEQKQTKKLTKITKVTLVIYCCVMLGYFISFLVASILIKDYSYLYGFLLCLGPGLLFVLISLFLPISNIATAKVGKGIIVWYVIAYVIKYAAIIAIPFIGIKWPENFNRWVMLATTLIAPITIIINKIVFANVVSKKPKNIVKS